MSEAASIIEEFKHLLAQEAPLLLTNIYKEVPIVHQALICDLRGEQLVLETSELQICAMHWSRGTIIQAPALKGPVEAQLEGSDIRRNLVTLSHFRGTELPHERRATVRVRLKKPIRVQIQQAQGAAVPGVIHDLSLGGCRISTGHNRAGEGELHLELELDGQRLRIPARLLRVEGGPVYHCTLLFEHSQESEQHLSVYIHKRELEIIKELQTTL